MVNMAYTTEELKERKKEYDPKDISNEPKYPYGLEMYLNDQIIKKLGMKSDDFRGGKTMTLTATVKVSGVNIREEADNEEKTTVNLQITDMEISGKPDTSKAADVLYPPKESPKPAA